MSVDVCPECCGRRRDCRDEETGGCSASQKVVCDRRRMEVERERGDPLPRSTPVGTTETYLSFVDPDNSDVVPWGRCEHVLPSPAISRAAKDNNHHHAPLLSSLALTLLLFHSAAFSGLLPPMLTDDGMFRFAQRPDVRRYRCLPVACISPCPLPICLPPFLPPCAAASLDSTLHPSIHPSSIRARQNQPASKKKTVASLERRRHFRKRLWSAAETLFPAVDYGTVVQSPTAQAHSVLE